MKNKSPYLVFNKDKSNNNKLLFLSSLFKKSLGLFFLLFLCAAIFLLYYSRKIDLKEDLVLQINFEGGESKENIVILSDRDYIEKDILYLIDKNNFNAVLSDIRDSILKHVWVEDVVIRKSWPATLYVDIKEHQPAAIVNQHNVLTNKMLLLEVDMLDIKKLIYALPSLPVFELPNKYTSEDALLAYNYYRKFSLDLASSIYTIDKLSYDDYSNVLIRLNKTLIVKLGREDHELRWKNVLLALKYFKIKQRKEPSCIDARYDNAIAIS